MGEGKVGKTQNSDCETGGAAESDLGGIVRGWQNQKGAVSSSYIGVSASRPVVAEIGTAMLS